MRTLVAILLGASAVGFTSTSTRPAGPAATTQSTQPAIRFTFVDVFVDSADAPLGAYQVELKAAHGDVRIVGIEGGEHPAFKEPPYYDPAALNGGRVILGAFSTARGLPVGHTRVARVHVMITGAEPPEYAIKLAVAADADGRTIRAAASVRQGDAG